MVNLTRLKKTVLLSIGIGLFLGGLFIALTPSYRTVSHQYEYPLIVEAQNIQSADPCATTSIPKLSAVINIASATTTSLVAPGVSSSAQINVCGLSFTLSGTTTPTFTLEYGTGATCGTGTTALTGAYLGGAASAPTAIFTGTGSVISTAPAANRVCALTGGTAPNAQGVITYVIQPQ